MDCNGQILIEFRTCSCSIYTICIRLSIWIFEFGYFQFWRYRLIAILVTGHSVVSHFSFVLLSTLTTKF